MLNETVKEPVKSKAQGFGRGYGRRNREDMVPTTLGVVPPTLGETPPALGETPPARGKPQAIGRGRPKSSIKCDQEMTSSKSGNFNSIDSTLDGLHSKPLPIYNTPMTVTSKSSPRSNNHYNSSPTNTPMTVTSKSSPRSNNSSPNSTSMSVTSKSSPRSDNHYNSSPTSTAMSVTSNASPRSDNYYKSSPTNTPMSVTSKPFPRPNNHYNSSSTSYKHSKTPPHSPKLHDNCNSPKDIKDRPNCNSPKDTNCNSPKDTKDRTTTLVHNDSSPESINSPPNPANKSPFDSKNRSLGRAKFSSPAFRPMTGTEDPPLPRGNRLPNGVQPGLNLTYNEPLEKGIHTKPDKIATTFLKGGQHLLDPNLTGEVHYHKHYYSKNKADKIYHMLMGSLNFVSPSKISKDGEIVVQPRISIWFGPPDHPYSYSYVTLQPHDFESNFIMKSVKNDMEHLFDTTFNSCLVNLYRDNNDGCGWHADDEDTLGPEPVIASVSLGETRRFQFCLKSDEERRPVYGFNLEHGSALLMKGDIQTHWLHKIPKERHDRKPRLNLTFRTIIKKQKTRR